MRVRDVKRGDVFWVFSDDGEALFVALGGAYAVRDSSGAIQGWRVRSYPVSGAYVTQHYDVSAEITHHYESADATDNESPFLGAYPIEKAKSDYREVLKQFGAALLTYGQQCADEAVAAVRAVEALASGVVAAPVRTDESQATIQKMQHEMNAMRDSYRAELRAVHRHYVLLLEQIERDAPRTERTRTTS